ncbi:dTDP-4-dehydrorhamnose reductase [Agromyces sp. Leaf222]|uniref:dTDP-4-dehydrorhamnose reductase n=1 Tax=Agromyces sp. Leaf222 TaxID=1735688 RepID=UPI0009E8B957|nr:dTDP-4-dehydrorhamnose reductase [Agromyces sp. Leaf222]
MRVLVTGAAGMLGRDLQRAFDGREVTALGRADLDVTDAGAVRDAVAGHDVVVNAAAYTAVDDAETHEAEAYAINATGPAILAAAAREHGAKLVTVSTDYVFDGFATEPYAEDRPRDPINAYGRTKAAGEELALAAHPEGAYVVRTAWLYGEHGPNFASTMLRIAAQRETWTVVDDQVGQPTWTLDLATRIRELLDADAPAGIYHGTNSGRTSWFGFARAVLEEAGLDPERIQPTTSAEFVRPAPRPAFSVLGHDAWRAAGLEPMRDWREALTASGIAAPAAS